MIDKIKIDKYHFYYVASWFFFVIKLPIKLPLFFIWWIGQQIEEYESIINFPESRFFYKWGNRHYYRQQVIKSKQQRVK